jgi:hypothetical protein
MKPHPNPLRTARELVRLRAEIAATKAQEITAITVAAPTTREATWTRL